MLIWSTLGPLLLYQLLHVKRLVLLNRIRMDQKPAYFRLNQTSDLLFAITLKALLAHNQILSHAWISRERDQPSYLDLRRIQLPNIKL